MSNNFKNSIAQANVQFPIETVVQPMAGENYSRALIFMPQSLAAANLPGLDITLGSIVELDASNYGDVCADKLKKWLTPYFTAAGAAKAGVVCFDVDTESTPEGEEEPVVVPATFPLEKAYEAAKMYAYFKFGLFESESENEQNVSLSNLCLSDPLYSVLWIGTSDGSVLTKESALIAALNTANSKARVIYNSDADINPALAQLGASLSVANATGTPVGNSVDMVQFNTIGASGNAGDDGKHDNLSATQKAALDEQYIGYQTTVGDGTENVVTEGGLNLKGESVGANWIKAYVEYVCKVNTANFITRMNKFRNNATYQAILLILRNTVQPFVDFGRLSNFKLTAPVFADLPKSGDAITVPNAWEAEYVDNVRTVTVYGTLYITQPSK